MKKLLTALCFSASLFLQIGLNAQTLFKYLQDAGLEHVHLAFEIDSLITNKFTAKVFVGHIAFTVDTGTMTLPVEVSVRGKFRRKECDLPPIKLEFKKGDLKDLGLKKDDSYKLVTHCLDDKRGVQYLYKEYSAYKMYNLVTDSSFQVQLFKITYENSRSGETLNSHAMLIESNEELEDRLDGKIDDSFGATVDSVDAATLEMTCLFNYMIGNQDMNLATSHNCKLMRKENGKMLTIPYDFDYSLLVNARYAFPGLEDNRTVKRKYNGYLKNKLVYKKILPRFMANEEAFVDVIKGVHQMKGSHRSEAVRYIQDFFYRLRSRSYSMDYIH